MIHGVGTDMIEVARIESRIRKEQGFRELVFSEAEIGYCNRKTHPYQHYAARFAAKEAFFKALGTGWINGTAFNEIEVVNDEMGRPHINLRGSTNEVVRAYNIGVIHVSLSHLQETASAFVVIESARNS